MTTAPSIPPDKLLEFYTSDLLDNWGYYSGPVYRRRNKLLANFLKPYNPSHVFEVAGAEGDLAETILSLLPIESYVWTDLVPQAADKVRERLKDFSNKLTAFPLDADKDYDKINFDQFDCFVSTALEHLIHDRKIISLLPHGCVVGVGLPTFGWTTHYRIFPKYSDIVKRYGDMVYFHRFGTIRYNYRRAVLVAIKRCLKHTHTLRIIQNRTGLFMFKDGPLFEGILYVAVGRRL